MWGIHQRSLGFHLETPYVLGSSDRGFKSRARNHLQADRPFKFRFEIVIGRPP